MAVNKVICNGETLMDLTGITLTSADQLKEGVIAHARDGSVLTGTATSGGQSYELESFKATEVSSTRQRSARGSTDQYASEDELQCYSVSFTAQVCGNLVYWGGAGNLRYGNSDDDATYYYVYSSGKMYPLFRIPEEFAPSSKAMGFTVISDGKIFATYATYLDTDGTFYFYCDSEMKAGGSTPCFQWNDIYMLEDAND